MTKYLYKQFLAQKAPVTVETTIELSGISALGSGTPPPIKRKLKIMLAEAHPDYPESMYGGAMAIFTNQGHEVVANYM